MRDQFLNECLVDSPESENKRKSARSGALVAALVFEAMAILMLALYPLLTPAKLRPRFVSAPIPVSYTLVPISNSPTAPAPRSHVARTVLFSPPSVPAHIFRAAVPDERAEAPASPPDFGATLPFGVADGLRGLGAGSSPIAPAAPVRVIRRSEKIEEGQLIRRVIPEYPEIARIARISGTVELLVWVGTNGLVKSVQVLSGSPLLAESAKAAVEQWRYRPAILDGQAVEVETRVTVHFVLNE